MAGRLIAATLFALSLVILNATAIRAADFPKVIGTWAGSYNVAFSKGHGHFSEEKKGVQMELRIFKQDENLIWAENRWRVNDQSEWHSEHTTGTFDLLDQTKLNIVEIAPKPGIGSTGFFEGRVKDGKMYLTYKGIGAGISFAAVLERK